MKYLILVMIALVFLAGCSRWKSGDRMVYDNAVPASGAVGF